MPSTAPSGAIQAAFEAGHYAEREYLEDLSVFADATARRTGVEKAQKRREKEREAKRIRWLMHRENGGSDRGLNYADAKTAQDFECTQQSIAVLRKRHGWTDTR